MSEVSVKLRVTSEAMSEAMSALLMVCWYRNAFYYHHQRLIFHPPICWAVLSCLETFTFHNISFCTSARSRMQNKLKTRGKRQGGCKGAVRAKKEWMTSMVILNWDINSHRKVCTTRAEKGKEQGSVYFQLLVFKSRYIYPYKRLTFLVPVIIPGVPRELFFCMEDHRVMRTKLRADLDICSKNCTPCTFVALRQLCASEGKGHIVALRMRSS